MISNQSMTIKYLFKSKFKASAFIVLEIVKSVIELMIYIFKKVRKLRE